MVHLNENGFTITVESAGGKNSTLEDFLNLKQAIRDVVKHYRYEDFGSTASEIIYPLIDLLESMEFTWEQLTASDLIDHCKPV